MAAGTNEEEKYDRQVEKGRLAEMVFSLGSGSTEVKEKVNVDDKMGFLSSRIRIITLEV